MTTTEATVLRKISEYHPKGGLDHTTRIFLALCSINHQQVKGHLERVGLLSERTAEILKKDMLAAFFGGLLHDIGKIVLPYTLFDGHNISPAEYQEVKRHTIAGFQILREVHEFMGLCAGFHHALYYSGYGLTADDFPKNWSPTTIKKILEISTIISICDFIDAATHRQTKILDGSGGKSDDLAEMLKKKYPDDIQVVEAALKANSELNL